MSTTLEPMAEFEADMQQEVGSEAGRPPHRPDLDRPRALGRRSGDDWYALLGSAGASLATVWLLYFQILPFSGLFGFVICWYLAFVVLYAGVTAITQPRPVVVDRIATGVVHGAAALVAIALGSTLIYIYVKGFPAYRHLNFFTHDTSAGPTAALTQGGISQAIVGTAEILGLAVVIALPLGLVTAVYLTEVGGRLAVAVRTVIEAMTALPDLVAGLFVYVVFRLDLHFHESGFLASMAIAITMTPIIARSSEVVLRSVPSGLREASAALGAPQWRTVVRVVLPTARAGLGTALILGIARGAGETAPLIIVASDNTFMNWNPLSGPMNSLPLYIYNRFRYGGGHVNAEARAYGAAAVLLTFILILFVIIRLLARERRAAR